MHRRCRSLCPWQRSLALALEDEDHDEQGECGNRRRDNCRHRQPDRGEQHTGHGCGRRPADGLSKAHERIEAALLPDRRQVDRHAVDRHVLGCCETVDEHAHQHQEADLFRRALDKDERQQ